LTNSDAKSSKHQMITDDMKTVNSGSRSSMTEFVDYRSKSDTANVGFKTGSKEKLTRLRGQSYSASKLAKSSVKRCSSNPISPERNIIRGERCVRNRGLSRISDNLELEVVFSDINQTREFEVLETDSIALLMYEIISAMVYPYEDLRL